MTTKTENYDTDFMAKPIETFGHCDGIITTWRDPHDTGIAVTRAKTVTFIPGVNVLVGCNGAGKSTLIHNIKSVCKKNNIPCISFDNQTEGNTHSIGKLLVQGDTLGAASMICSSEGERIVQSINYFARKIGSLVTTKYDKASEIWILLDASDSGLSVDNVIELKDFFQFLQKQEPHRKLYIVVAANEYEMASGEQCIDVIAGKPVTFLNYDEYRDFIIKSRKRKEKREERKSALLGDLYLFSTLKN